MAAALAMVSFLACSVLGPILVLWWAHRRQSVFAKRYAIVSLALEIPILVAILLMVPVMFVASATVTVLVFFVLWLGQLALVGFALYLATTAWRGIDPQNSPIPAALADRLPGYA